MSDYVIDAEPRTILKKKVSQLRARGIVPGTVYGPKIEPVNIQIPYRALEVTLRTAGGTNLIDLQVGKETYTVLAREVQRDVIKGTILHVDFFAVDETSAIRAAIPIHLVGTSPVVEARQGILVTGTNTITIETLPGKLMNQIVLDISTLVNIGDSITVADLDLGEEIIILDDPDEVLARVAQTSAGRAEEDLFPGEEIAEGKEEETGAGPEIITRGKGEEGEA